VAGQVVVAGGPARAPVAIVRVEAVPAPVAWGAVGAAVVLAALGWTALQPRR